MGEDAEVVSSSASTIGAGQPGDLIDAGSAVRSRFAINRGAAKRVRMRIR